MTPQYVIPDAYAALSGAPYPWSLPFDQPLAEARIFLRHLGIDRAKLMRLFRRPGDPDNVAIAAEELGLSAADRRQLAAGKPSEPWRLWGMPPASAGHSWHDPLATDIPLLLKRAQLQFADARGATRYRTRSTAAGQSSSPPSTPASSTNTPWSA